MENYEKFVNGSLTLHDIKTDREYANCVLEYQKSVKDLASDGHGLIELQGINNHLERLQDTGVVRDINYGANSIKLGDQIEPIPISFELDKSILVEGNRLDKNVELDGVYNLESSDHWDWKPVDGDGIMEERWDYVSKDADILVKTSSDEIDEGLSQSENFEAI